MQITDMLGQYNRNVANKTEELHGSQGVQKLVSTVRELSAGSVFEGTVNHIRNGKVVLALGNGQTILARLDGKVNVQQGTSMFFQVKSNDGTTVAIRPYTGVGNASNPILLNALTAAGVPVNDRSLTMVDAMMQEQMAIGKNSILDMVKIIGSHPNIDVATMVKMTKLGIPITDAMAAQFENYVSDQHAILNELDAAMNQITAAFSDENLSGQETFSLYSKVLDILNGKADGSIGAAMADNMQADAGKVQDSFQIPNFTAGIDGNPTEKPAGNPTEKPGGMANPAGNAAAEAANAAEKSVGNPTEKSGGMENPAAKIQDPAELQTAAAGEQEQNANLTLGQLLDGKQLENLTRQLEGVPVLAGNTELFLDSTQEEVFVDTMSEDIAGQEPPNEQPAAGSAVLDKDMPVSKFLNTIQEAFVKNNQYGYAGIQKLFAGKEFKTLMRGMIEQQWTVKPEQLKEENKISQLYEKMEQQIRQLDSAMKMAGVSTESFAQTASDIRGNIEFMNQINQMYTYVQIPLKMTGQNANGELYVYTNKKKLRDPDTELTAFLHLDMENLGSTDVSVRMLHRKVNTNFYFSDDTSYDLVEKHLPVLEKHLKNRGYQCSITMSKEKKEVNFVDDFLRKDQPQAGTLHRYSFDVKA